MRISAPWNDEQVAKLNEFQRYTTMHPFTCGSNRHDVAHVAWAEEHDEDNGQLVATNAGWICPVCNYTQNWAHDFMFEGAGDIGSKP